MQISLDPKIERFISSLNKETIAKVLRTIDLLEEFGHQLGMPHSKKVATWLFELRIRGKQEIRIFYAFHKGAVHLLHGFVKKSQKTPRKELAIAITKLKSLTRYNL
jgi:phage-related protein